MKPHRFYKFGHFLLDATAKVLLREGQSVNLTRKAVDTLLVLVENAGQVVPKDEMISTIWPDRVVDEANLTQNIAMVRKALAVSSDSPAFIETFPGRGYRLAGPVEIERAEQNGLHEIAASLTREPGLSESIPSSTEISAPAKKIFTPKYVLPTVLSLCLLVLVSAWFYFRYNSQIPSTDFRVSALTRLPGEERQPALSPDGKRIAFLWDQGQAQTPAIFWQTLGEGSAQQLTKDEGQYNSPVWSSDGNALAYLRTDKTATQVLIRSLQSGEERLVTQFTPPIYGFQQRFLAWSSDGKWLVISHHDSPERPNGLTLVSVTTGEKKKLTAPAAMVGGDMDPQFSPDNQTITFIRAIHRTHQEIYSVSIAGGEPQPLTTEIKQISSHDWLPDGSAIVFASNRGGEFRLWKLYAKKGGVEAIGIYGEYPIELALARNAPVLVYSIQPQDRNIWQLNLSEKKWKRIIASSAQDASPQYSPQGDKICFRSDRSGEEALWVSDADGNNQQQITRDPLYPSFGNWSPDGKQIVFNNSRTTEIYLAEQNADGNWVVKNLNVKGVHPIFAPDNKFIYAGTTSNIIRIDPQTGIHSELVKIGGFSLGIARDGATIYFVREVNDTTLWQVDTATGAYKKALDGLLPSCTSCWSLTPRGIYFLGSKQRSFDQQSLYFHDFATGREQEIVAYPEPLTPVGSGPFSLSPDLVNLLCVRVAAANSDIMRAEPFR